MKWLTVSAVAEFLSVSTKTVRRWITSGRLAAVNLGRPGRAADWRVSDRALATVLGSETCPPEVHLEAIRARSVGELRRKAA